MIEKDGKRVKVCVCVCVDEIVFYLKLQKIGFRCLKCSTPGYLSANNEKLIILNGNSN